MRRITIILFALSLAACGGDDDEKDKGSSPAPDKPPPAAPAAPGPQPFAPTAPDLDLAKMGVGDLDLNAPTGLPECDELFAYVRDKFMTCDKIPQVQRDMMKSNMMGMNVTIRRSMQMGTPALKAKLVAACQKGVKEAHEDYQENCK